MLSRGLMTTEQMFRNMTVSPPNKKQHILPLQPFLQFCQLIVTHQILALLDIRVLTDALKDLKIHQNSLAGISQPKIASATLNTCSTVPANPPMLMRANPRHLSKKQ